MEGWRKTSAAPATDNCRIDRANDESIMHDGPPAGVGDEFGHNQSAASPGLTEIADDGREEAPRGVDVAVLGTATERRERLCEEVDASAPNIKPT